MLHRPLSIAGLRTYGGRTACIVGDRVVTHAELADLVAERRRELGATRHLVVLHGTNSLEFVVTYLAALDGHHPVVVAADHRSALTLGERMGATLGVDASSAGSARIDQMDTGRTPTPHRDLAVLMSTSGSTGSPKLVRLSLDAITSNALAIAQALGIRADDRAITSLPLHYCYGLSVVTSHLAVGASVVLTDTSVVDPCFWKAVEDHDVTTLSGVPHTFEMIERLKDDVLAAPSLRRVTQAGGRMGPDAVERFARRGHRHGWEFFVMYGQTEATARMSILPSNRALSAPTSVGMPIPGGNIRLDPVPEADSGVAEVVYTGPNVMMGYATSADDLSRGYDIDELRTGDLGRFDGAGNLEIVGRLNRFVKLHGKRIDLDHLTDEITGNGIDPTSVHVTGDDEGIVIGILDRDAREASLDEEMRVAVAERGDVPRGRVLAIRVPELPRTSSGKADGAVLIESARQLAAATTDQRTEADATVADAFRQVFGFRPGPDATFAGLGGDSFSYIEMSIRLEPLLGSLPSDWHLRPVADLEAVRTLRPTSTRWRRWTRNVETSFMIRAVGILLIVGTHMGIFRLAGGAHALLAVVGYNVARFQLSAADVPGRSRRSFLTVARIALPTSIWIGLNMLLVGGYSLGAVLLVNSYTGSAHRSDGRWEYWYFEAFVQIMIVIALVFSVSSVRRAERARPFMFALGVLGLTWLFRFEIVNIGGAYNEIFRPHTVASFVAIGWCAQRASNTTQRIIVTVLAAITTLGYFETVGRSDQLDRELRILAAVLALVWIGSVRLPTPVAVVITRLAAASMWIFLVHWQVWPMFTPWLDDRTAFVATIAVGVGVWWTVEAVSRAIAEWRQRRIEGRSTSSQVSSPDTVTNSSDATPVSA